MRCLLLLLAFTFAAVLSAQVKTDTLYNRWGELNQVRYSSAMDVEGMSQADRFQRGIRAGDKVFQLDSIRLVNGEKTKLITGEEMNGVPMPGLFREGYVNPTKAVTKRKTKTNENSTWSDYVEGRAGMRVQRMVLPVATGKNVEEMKRLDDSPEIELLEMIPGEKAALKAKVHIPAGATDRKLILDFGNGKKWEKLYTIRGYHLNEADFKRKDQLTAAQTWRAEGQDYLYLRLRSTEKLLYISQGETRYKPVPVGRQLDEVYLKGLATGKYLLEIIDLGTKEKRYHWLAI